MSFYLITWHVIIKVLNSRLLHLAAKILEAIKGYSAAIPFSRFAK
jgi:hypothetical protein